MNSEIILVKDKINNLCQINHFIQPQFISFPHFNQRIPCIIIGSVVFNGLNWMVDDRTKTVKLSNFVISKLLDPIFVQQNTELLKRSYYNYTTVNIVEDTEPTIIFK